MSIFCGWFYFNVIGVVLRMILAMFWRIWKARIKTGLVSSIVRAHLSQLMIVHLLLVFAFGMSIAGIRHVDSWGRESTFGMSIAGNGHVDSWGVTPAFGVCEHWATKGNRHVMRSFALLLLSGMLVQYGLLGRSSISFLSLRIVKFYLLNDQKTNQLTLFSLLFVSKSGCIVFCYY